MASDVFLKVRPAEKKKLMCIMVLLYCIAVLYVAFTVYGDGALVLYAATAPTCGPGFLICKCLYKISKCKTYNDCITVWMYHSILQLVVKSRREVMGIQATNISASHGPAKSLKAIQINLNGRCTKAALAFLFHCCIMQDFSHTHYRPSRFSFGDTSATRDELSWLSLSRANSVCPTNDYRNI